MTNNETQQVVERLGEEEPLIAGGRNGPPDRREISTRWLVGTFLTGVTSTVLMGVALSAAVDGREQLATPPEIALLGELSSEPDAISKTGRVLAPSIPSRATDRRRMEVSTLIRSGDREVVRVRPFVHARMALSANHTTSRDYPAFNPLTVFSGDAQTATAQSTGLIYGAKVESEVSLKTVDFPLDTGAFDPSRSLSTDEVELMVRNTGAILTNGDVQVASLHYVDPQRFGETLSTQALSAFTARIVRENVSVASRNVEDGVSLEFAEDIIPFRTERSIAEAFALAGYQGPDVDGMAEAIAKLLNAESLKAGTVLRVGIETRGEESRVVRTSVYDSRTHVLTIAVDDNEQFVPAAEPDINPVLLAAFENPAAVRRPRADLPRVYDGIYRAAYSYGLTDAMTKRLIRMLSADVDFQSRLGPTDQLEVFFSNPGEGTNATDESELLYVKASFGGEERSYYRFQTEDGSVDYFDEEGRSSRRFMLRNPVPNGRFTSGFGMRRHPVLGYSKMHTGVDWAAPRGTPIIASGDGVVEKAGWAGGYGRQTILRHNNGFKTSYNHQSGIAKGVTPGARVRQGQVIGYVGATGLVTGNHLHYEMMVNGTKVDPMRVRLPDSKALKGEELEAFQRERERIDTLLHSEDNDPISVAARG